MFDVCIDLEDNMSQLLEFYVDAMPVTTLWISSYGVTSKGDNFDFGIIGRNLSQS